MTASYVLLALLIAVALLALGVLVGWNAHGMREEQRALAAEQRRETERMRRIHDTQRVSVARPGTKPGRVSKASIDMSASHMHQHEREV